MTKLSTPPAHTSAPIPFGSPIPYAEPLWYSRDASPFYHASHRRLRAFVRRYVDEELAPHAYEWETAGEVPAEVFKRHAALGFFAVGLGLEDQVDALPAGIPAREWDAFHSLIVTDELNRIGYQGALWGLGAGNGIGVPPIVNFGTPEQKARFLPDVARGEIRFCLGITEPDAGSDVAALRTTAVLQPDGHYLVNGSKKWITNGLWADFCTAAVRTSSSPSGPEDGISVLIIPLALPGVSRRRMPTSGVHASGSTFLSFDNVRVPARDFLLHKPGAGLAVVFANFNPERVGLSVAALRMARTCVEDAYAHARDREVFGEPLLARGVVRAKLVRMGGMIEAAWALAETVTWLVQRGDGAEGGGGGLVMGKLPAKTGLGGMTALLKVVSTCCLEVCAREAQQIMGGLGYTKGGKGGRIEAIGRDVRVFVVGGGSVEVMAELALREEAKDLEKAHAKL